MVASSKDVDFKKNSIAFITSNANIVSLNSNFKEHFSNENSAFLVVGVLGRKGVGKSTVLNLIANRDTKTDYPVSLPFPIVEFNKETEDLICPKTKNIEIHITSDRVICIDTYPIFQANHLDVFSKADGEPKSFSRLSEYRSLQVISWLFNVCHVVICVQDTFNDLELNRMIDFSASLRPSVLVQSHLLKTKKLGRAQHLAKLLKQKLAKDSTEKDFKFDNSLDSNFSNMNEYEKEDFYNEQNDRDLLSQAHDDKLLNMNTDKLRRNRDLNNTLTDEENLVSELTGIGEFFNHLQNIKQYGATLVNVFNSIPSSELLKYHPKILLSIKNLLAKTQTLRLENALQTSVGPKLLNKHLEKRLVQTHESYTKRINAIDSEKYEKENSGSVVDPTLDESSSLNSVSQSQEVSNLFSRMNVLETNTFHSLESQFHSEKAHDSTISHKEENSQNDAEEEIVDECLKVINHVSRPIVPNALPIKEFRTNSVDCFSGEELKTHLKNFSDCVTSIRAQYLQPENSVTNSICVLIPEIIQPGFPSELSTGVDGLDYQQCAKNLRGTILSTPREHMLPGMTERGWLEYAQQMWNFVKESPLLKELTNIWDVIDCPINESSSEINF